MNCKLIVVGEPKFDVNMDDVGIINQNLSHLNQLNEKFYVPIPNLYYNASNTTTRVIYSTQHDGKWYHLCMMVWYNDEHKLIDLIESGLEPYQAFEVLAL